MRIEALKKTGILGFLFPVVVDEHLKSFMPIPSMDFAQLNCEALITVFSRLFSIMAELKADDWRNIEIDVRRQDIEKIVYFILEMVLDQKKKDKPMQGALTTKGDLMGGIFDRWINLIPESIVLNKRILPEVSGGADVSAISDFYKYKPKDAGIAPDVLGLKINNKSVAFCEFRDKWTPVEGMPQIEIKTFKEKQMMVSLRNQGYEGEYLILIESKMRIDYLLPFFNPAFFKKNLHKSLEMDDGLFKKSDSKNLLESFNKIDDSLLENDKLGSITVLGIFKADDFIRIATLAGPKESVKYFNGEIAKAEKKTQTENGDPVPLKDVCELDAEKGLYHFDQKKMIDKLGDNASWGKNSVFLDFSAENIGNIVVRKLNKESMYVDSIGESAINGTVMNDGCRYKIEFKTLSRGSSSKEYFIHKANVNLMTDCSSELFKDLREIISKYT